jgi:hypothetical protein
LFRRRKCNEGIQNKEDGIVPLKKLWDKSRMFKSESLLNSDGMCPISWLLDKKSVVRPVSLFIWWGRPVSLL